VKIARGTIHACEWRIAGCSGRVCHPREI
jgi:hypothetical protein